MAKAKKEPVDVEKALSMIEIAQELKFVVDNIVDAGGECDDVTLAALVNWQAAVEVKAENIGHVKLRLENEAAYYKQIEEAARARRKARESAVERLTGYLARCMGVAGVKSIKRNDGLFSFSLCNGRAQCVINDEGKLPYDLVSVVELIKPKTAEIKALLEAGQQIPGAELQFGQDYVTIRSANNKEKKEDE